MDVAQEPILDPSLFDRLDDSPDAGFYLMPRLVAHIDEATIGALTAYYREILAPGADVLDLMSSWISHLPDDLPLGRVAGLGMNESELQANSRLSDHTVHDLNTEPTLPYRDGTFDFVFIAVSIQYLVQPVAVFRHIARVLRPNGLAVVATSHRCFPTKAIRAFHERTPAQRLELITQYFDASGGFASPQICDRSPAGADPLWLVSARTRQARPIPG